jgi:uncharacterized protein
MRIEGQRRSEKFEDRGQSGGGGGTIGGQGLLQVVRLLGVKGTLVAGVVLGAVYLFAPAGLKQSLLQLVGGSSDGQSTSSSGAKGACTLSKTNEQACDFSRVVLASTEDVWTERFSQGALPSAKVGQYVKPTLVVFSNRVSTGGCGSATSAVGPFYCPGDGKLYIDPTFYQVMEAKLKAPGDFAQAYVIAHEVGHHVQNLIGSSRRQVAGDSKNQTSVRVELQADCFAGVWGHAAKSTLSITEEDLGEALTAAHAIGDDTLGHADKTQFTHGSSAQRIRWFRRGFDGGDARNCDTFAESSYSRL